MQKNMIEYSYKCKNKIFGGFMSNELYGQLSVITMRGGEDFAKQVDDYLMGWRSSVNSFIVDADCPRFGSGEGKGALHQSLRGHDVFIICDVFNYGATYTMYGQTVPMSPDDHFQDLKRVIGSIAGKAKRISVIMPMLYEGRQHKRSSRESLDCAMALQELVNIGVTNILTFDAHDPRVQNAIPLCGFDDIRPTYQMIKAFIKDSEGLSLNENDIAVVSPDEGGMNRAMYYSSVLKLDLGMFYKRRDYTKIVNGRNPIVAHEYLGRDVAGKDIIVVDDMISSGDSIIEVATHLKKMGAKRIFVFATFGLFCNGYENFDKAFANGDICRIFTTNLIYRPDSLKNKPWYREVNMCKYVSLLIDTLNHDESISSILNPVNKIHAYVDRAVADGKVTL